MALILRFRFIIYLLQHPIAHRLPIPLPTIPFPFFIYFPLESGLTGTKLGCAEGGCGACTVMVSSLDTHTTSTFNSNDILHRSVNACLCPLYAIEGMSVITVEGLGNPRDGLHPVQERLSKSHGSQCGFCTPGFVMSMYALLRSKAETARRLSSSLSSPVQITEEEIEENLAGNLCRCTGYRPILAAFKTFATEAVDPAIYTQEAVQAASGIHTTATAKTNGGNGKVCPSTGKPCDCSDGTSNITKNISNTCCTSTSSSSSSSSSREPIFPPELRRRHPPELHLPGLKATWHRPTTLQRLFEIKAQHPEAKLVVGNTEVGIEMKFKNAGYTHLIGATHVAELNGVEVTQKGVTFGASVTLTTVMEVFKSLIDNSSVGIDRDSGGDSKRFQSPPHPPSSSFFSPVKLQGYQTSGLKAVVHQLKWFAGPPIRNIASLGGNIVTASPISDLNPIWMSCGATVIIAGLNTGIRTVPVRDFIKGYRRVDLASHEVVIKLHMPFTSQYEYVKEFKQAHRREDDIAIVNGALRLAFITATNDATHGSTKGDWVIGEASLAYGGVAPATIMFPATAASLIGKPPSQETFQEAWLAIERDISMDSNAPGGMVQYRLSLIASFLFKGLIHAARQLEADLSLAERENGGGGATSSSSRFTCPFDDRALSAASTFHRPPSQGLQYYTPPSTRPNGQSPAVVVLGESHRHMAADLQVCGGAQYVDDIPLPPKTLHAVFVLSTEPHAKLVKVDTTAALNIPGVVGVYTAQHIPGHNDIGAVIHDEELLATEVVTCVGQPIAVVAAETEAAAREAARAVVVEYEKLRAVLSIYDAVHAESFYDGFGHSVEKAPDTADGMMKRLKEIREMGSSSNIDENNVLFVGGTMRMGGQEHFYLEPNACLVLPGEGGEFTAWASTQCPEKHQRYIAHCLGIPMHRIVVKTKRLGGGFGGKETRSAFINAAAAVAAYHTRRPVRMVLDRDEDMAITGHRHAFIGLYTAAADKTTGKLLGLDLQLYNNGGNSLDLSASIMDRALVHCDNSYKWPVLHARGEVCRTNMPSNTAFRGFGGPQGMMVTEDIIDAIARGLRKCPDDIRDINLYAPEGDVTHFGQLLEGCQVRACWDTVVNSSDYTARKAQVEAFNKQHRYRKRGMALIPTKFGISFTTKFLNQAGALVHIYTDGTVLLTHGGVEMGQGLHTKVAQVVAQSLRVPLSDVYVAETATDKVPNASPTAASASSDMYGAAAADACRQLNERLEVIRRQLIEKNGQREDEKSGDGTTPTTNTDITMKEIAKAAHMARIDLSAHGFHSTPDVTGFEGDRPFNYFCYGAAASEVELDTLTGDWHVLRTDICMDVGQSINPAIDIGQVEGGFVQGLGWSCVEELVWGDGDHTWVKPGTLHTRGPGTYKIPTANDIPVDFRVTLLRDAPCARTPAVHSSKAVGEPPFFLGTSVFWALKEACYSARRDAGLEGYFRLDLPATPERLRMACVDEIIVETAGGKNMEEAGRYMAKLSC
jgi:xanthine dehydrogenase/oxidase